MGKPLQGVSETAVVGDGRLQIALDNMPGALVYTDENQNIVFCNDRFREMYPVPAELLRPGQPYAQFLRHLATHGYYGEGDADAMVARRLESLRHPTGKSFEDNTPDGRCYRVMRRAAATGGAVTVMTDVTEQKRAEQALIEAKERLEQANGSVSAKNRMLEALSSKLSKYLSPQVYESIFSGAQTVEISAKRKKLTVFFSDIAGFTETTDQLEAEELTEVLNQYLTEMSKIALTHGATIDKFIGDAMLLFFGDPETRGMQEDAKACVMMAIAMQRRMRELEQEWRARGFERPFRMRIGISTGFATVGNFGSHDRMDYTIYGNQVNLAARLQSAAEPGGHSAVLRNQCPRAGNNPHRRIPADDRERLRAANQRLQGSRHLPGAGRRRQGGAAGARWFAGSGRSDQTGELRGDQGAGGRAGRTEAAERRIIVSAGAAARRCRARTTVAKWL